MLGNHLEVIVLHHAVCFVDDEEVQGGDISEVLAGDASAAAATSGGATPARHHIPQPPWSGCHDGRPFAEYALLRSSVLCKALAVGDVPHSARSCMQGHLV